MLISEVLNKAADLIEPEGAWTQGRDAAGAQGQGVALDSDKAVSWCMVGAIRKVMNAGKGDTASALVSNFLRSGLGISPMTFNDNPKTTQQMVVNKLREAAKEALSKNL